ncbi:hypothetical protein Rmf_03560 [Roseomonas fluvialis]|uniref:Uncharacterized protein n=1 Tax=Roseomonas fluvialis TaxID=1750527 RepID=A0ABM7XY56_9PROT|nr:hypothetical protein Rmf_03560 [Roseomonas fluvialis]
MTLARRTAAWLSTTRAQTASASSTPEATGAASSVTIGMRAASCAGRSHRAGTYRAGPPLSIASVIAIACLQIIHAAACLAPEVPMPFVEVLRGASASSEQLPIERQLAAFRLLPMRHNA